jgi:hypothetical protein
MSLFTLIKYPVDKETADFRHVPDDIWDAYIRLRENMADEEITQENNSNAVIIKVMMEWEGEE